MSLTCGICHEAESKYTCPTCLLKYCSLACYKPHKACHGLDSQVVNTTTVYSEIPSLSPVHQIDKSVHRPGTTTSRQQGPDFTSLGSDPDFRHLLKRYPQLRLQLQVIFGLTLDPGPEDARNWARGPLPSLQRPRSQYQRGGRGGRRAPGFRGGRGGRGGFTGDVDEERQHGMWTREKGDKEALIVIKRMREGGGDDERAEGIREFGRLVAMKFGGGGNAGGNTEMG